MSSSSSSTSANGSESVSVKLKLAGKFIPGESSKTWQFAGSTGKDHGHAEMDALHNMIMWIKERHQMTSIDTAVLKTYGYLITGGIDKTVSCPDKKVCVSCSKALKALGFKSAAGTSWGTEKAGTPTWQASQPVQKLLRLFGEDVYSSAVAAHSPNLAVPVASAAAGEQQIQSRQDRAELRALRNQ